MGFLKRFFSIGNKKKQQKKSFLTHQYDQGVIRIQEEEQEAALSRVLRSSSTRFAVVSEVDYTSLPPLPHPIHNVVNAPETSSVGLGTEMVNRQGTYRVTIHRRTRCTLPRSPHANIDPSLPSESDPARLREFKISCRQQCEPNSTRCRAKSTPVSMTQRDSNSLQVLRQDPSVISLVTMYDNQGCLPDKAFSNTPPPPAKGREQVKRNGSTLRQLLGNPVSRALGNDSEDGNVLDGDISWAEHMLGEDDDANSFTSSCDNEPELAIDMDTLLPDIHLSYERARTTLKEYDHDSSDDNPAISSMDVEVSIVTDSPPLSVTHNPNSPYRHENPLTLQRASQVFGFVAERRRLRVMNEINDPPRPFLTFPVYPNPESPIQPHFPASSTEHDYAQMQESTTFIPFSHDTHVHRHVRRRSLSSPHSFVQSSNSHSHTGAFPSQRGTRTTSISLPPSYKNSVRISPQESPNFLPRNNDSGEILRGDTPISLNGSAFNLVKRSPPRASDVPKGLTRKDKDTTSLLPPFSEVMVDLHNESTRHPRNIPADCATLFVFSEKRSNVAGATALEDDHFTPMPPRKCRTLRRVADRWPNLVVPEQPRGAVYTEAQAEKENSPSPSPSEEVAVPVTPMRTRLRIPFGLDSRPSLSSELSPVAQQLMTDLRGQRMRARDKERKGRQRR